MTKTIGHFKMNLVLLLNERMARSICVPQNIPLTSTKNREQM